MPGDVAQPVPAEMGLVRPPLPSLAMGLGKEEETGDRLDRAGEEDNPGKPKSGWVWSETPAVRPAVHDTMGVFGFPRFVNQIL